MDNFWPWAERYIALDTSRTNAGVEAFARDLLAPHKLTYKGEKVVGLGVVDVKLDDVCKAFALQRLDLSRLKKPLHLLATYGEEVGLQGAKAFMSFGVKPEWVLCGEPSDLTPCHSHKGDAMTRVAASVDARKVTAEGKAAHSSTPALGVNAIARLLDQLPDAPLSSLSGGSSPRPSQPAPKQASFIGKVCPPRSSAPAPAPAMHTRRTNGCGWGISRRPSTSTRPS